MGSAVRCTYRWYDPNAGRWISRDPKGYGGGGNLYEYCVDNSLIYGDPLGLDWLDNGASFFGGWGDALTFGGTKWLRLWGGELCGVGDANQAVNYNSGWYTAGEILGTANGIAAGGVGSLNAGARPIFYAGEMGQLWPMHKRLRQQRVKPCCLALWGERF